MTELLNKNELKSKVDVIDSLANAEKQFIRYASSHERR